MQINQISHNFFNSLKKALITLHKQTELSLAKKRNPPQHCKLTRILQCCINRKEKNTTRKTHRIALWLYSFS